MKARIFRRIFIIYAVIVLIAAAFTEVYITSAVRENHINNLKQHLMDKVSLLSKVVSIDLGNLDGFCKEAKEDVHARVTVILKDGRVIGDSDHESSTMENHADRTEVQQAASFGTGMSIRYSDTLKYDFLYVAGKVMRNETD